MNFLAKTVCATVLAACGSTAFGGAVANLAPNQTVTGLSGITNTVMPELIGTTISDKYLDFSIYGGQSQQGSSLLYQGTLMTRVVQSNQTGNLHFNYRIMNPNTQLAGVVSHVELTGFEGFTTRVEYRNELTAPGQEGPNIASRSVDGDMLNFSFNGGLATGDESRFFFAMLDTQTFYEDSTIATIYLESGESVRLIVDGASVPTPGSLGLLSVAGLIVTRRRR